MVTDLRPLLARLEEATGPSRTLDYAIASALFDATLEKNYWHWQGSRPQGSPHKEPDLFWDDRHTPKYTESIDAALALVERVKPGHAMAVLDAAISSRGDPMDWQPRDAPTLADLPLSILSALLRSTLSEHPE